MTKRTFFLPPDFMSFPAETKEYHGKIRLGQLISDIKDPGHPIGTLPPLDLKSYPTMQVGTVKQAMLDHTNKATSSSFAKLLIKAVELVGADLEQKTQRSSELLSAIAEIEVKTMDPSDSYVEASLQQAKVQSWMKRTWGRKRIFMVSDILIARPGMDSTIRTSENSSLDTSANVKVDGSTAQAPVSSGMEAGSSFSNEFGLGFVPKTPFIYAFKLRRCYFEKAEGWSEQFYKGAKMHAREQGSDSDTMKEEDLVFEFSGIDKDDLNVQSLGLDDRDFQEVEMNGDGGDDGCSLVMLSSK
ncbi:hypothetical protein V498_04005 [Pseudogymnoascus sp. VKM F-4517 (FW-2822)]|nr:hypothetical protein V498_04005 [Pseudogymnoascus sp. VKM F-4517 (FW-2822)]